MISGRKYPILVAPGCFFLQKIACSVSFLKNLPPISREFLKMLQTTLKFYVNFFENSPFLT